MTAVPTRIQLRRTRGWRKPPGAIVVARGTRWGNPYTVAGHGRDRALELYRANVLTDPAYRVAVRRELPGHDLACWCPLDLPCHADLLLAVANERTPT